MERSAEEIRLGGVHRYPEGPGPVPAIRSPMLLPPRPGPASRLADAVRSEPGRSLLIAACAGFLVGRLLKLVFRRARRR